MSHVRAFMSSRLAPIGLLCVLVLVPGCRRAARVKAEPLPQVPAPFASPPVLPGAVDVAALVERVRPAVVNITAVHEITVHMPAWPFGEWLPAPGRGRGGDEVLREGALGSGFLIDREGHVVTNAHVVDQAELVEVKLADDREYRARSLARTR